MKSLNIYFVIMMSFVLLSCSDSLSISPEDELETLDDINDSEDLEYPPYRDFDDNLNDDFVGSAFDEDESQSETEDDQKSSTQEIVEEYSE